jgi:hypothetical protein
MFVKTALIVGGCLAAAACTGNSEAQNENAAAVTQSDSAQFIARNLAKFDTLDYDVFSHQQWDRFKESHAQDIIVTWPDGHETRGIDKHIEDLKAMFVYAPDTQIKEHPIRIGNGSWTAVAGVMTGTFTKPMPLADGTSIPPTGKKFSLPMATIGHWTEAGVMDREWLFWDNETYKKQLGLIK